jgi:hypothetical protein
VALVLLVAGFAAAGPAIANPGIDDPQFQPGGDGPPPPDPPEPGADGFAPGGNGPPQPEPDPDPPTDGGGSGSSGGGSVDPAPPPVPEVEPVEDDGVPVDGTPGKEAGRPDAETEVAAGPELVADADSSSVSFVKLALGAFSLLLALAAALFGLVLWRRSREDEEAPATF